MTAKSTSDAILQAVDVLNRGGLVAFPTETVYGLGADASNPDAIQAIYAAKGRPSHHPVIVHVAEPSQIWRWINVSPKTKALAHQLVAAFWPGPLTLIFKRHSSVPASVSGGQDTIGIRCPSHPIAHALLAAFASTRGERLAGIAAPSANRFGHVSPTRAQHVVDEFADLVAQGLPVLDGGDSEVGIESTILDLSRIDQGHGVALLRPGGIEASAIEAIIGEPLQGPNGQAPRVSGSLKAHYSPRTPMQLCDFDALPALTLGSNFATNNHDEWALVLRQSQFEQAHAMIASSAKVSLIALPDDPMMYARQLYAQLRELDQGQFFRIVWLSVPEGQSWDAVRDRLTRAAAAFEGRD